MFASDPNPANWSQGGTIAFQGTRPEALQLYLGETYSQSVDLQAMEERILRMGFTPVDDIVLESLQLANKLNNVHLQTIGLGNEIYPCHSSILALHSRVLAEMFVSDSNSANWSKGVTAAFLGTRPEALKLYLGETYSQSFRLEALEQRILPFKYVPTEHIVLDTLKLANKLNNVHLQTVFEGYLLAKIQDHIPKLRLFLEVAIQCGAERLQSACIAKMFMEIVNGVRDTGDMNSVPIQTQYSRSIEELFCYEVLPSVRRKLHKANAHLLLCGLRDGKNYSNNNNRSSYGHSTFGNSSKSSLIMDTGVIDEIKRHMNA